MNNSNQRQNDVTRFFDDYADDFHRIYGREGTSTLGGLVDKVTRRGMFARFEEVMRQCRSENAETLLDVGCGPGFHDAILASELNMQIQGIDIAPNMIELAKSNVEKRGVADGVRAGPKI
jgi:predicted TPR repeat methyltransferase